MGYIILFFYNTEVVQNKVAELGATNPFMYVVLLVGVQDIIEEVSVCITGKLSVKRSEFEWELKAAGFTPVSSVTKKTQYLITDDPNSGSSKNTAAKKFGTVVMSEQEFRDKFLSTIR